MTSVEIAKCLGHPSKSKADENVDYMKEVVLRNRYITVCVAASILRILFGSVENENDLKSGIQGMGSQPC